MLFIDCKITPKIGINQDFASIIYTFTHFLPISMTYIAKKHYLCRRFSLL